MSMLVRAAPLRVARAAAVRQQVRFAHFENVVDKCVLVMSRVMCADRVNLFASTLRCPRARSPSIPRLAAHAAPPPHSTTMPLPHNLTTVAHLTPAHHHLTHSAPSHLPTTGPSPPRSPTSSASPPRWPSTSPAASGSPSCVLMSPSSPSSTADASSPRGTRSRRPRALKQTICIDRTWRAQTEEEETAAVMSEWGSTKL